MILFLLFLACNTPSSPKNDIVPPTPVATTSAPEEVVEIERYTPPPAGETLCINLNRVTWKGDIWLVGGDAPSLAEVDRNEGTSYACAFGYPISHPRYVEFLFCEKRSGRGECITVLPELETLDE